MSSFLGDAGMTPLGASLVRWSQATEECALIADEATCAATDNIDPTTATESESSNSNNNNTEGSNATLSLAPLAAVAGLLTVWAFGSLVLGRNSKKQKVSTDVAHGLSIDAAALFKSPVDGVYDDLRVIKTEPPSTVTAQSWTESAMYDVVGRGELADLPGMATESVPWSDYIDTGASAAPFHLPFLGGKVEPGADSPWEDTGSDAEGSSGPASIVGDMDSPYSDYYSTPETDVTSNSTPPNLASIQQGGALLDSFITGLTYEEAASLSSMPDLPPPQPPSIVASYQQPNMLLQPPTLVGQSVVRVVSAAASLASVNGATAQPGRSTPVLLPQPASKQGSATKAKRGHRKRKLTEQKKEAVTGVVFMLCRSGALSALEQLPEATLRERYDIDPAAVTGSVQTGVLLRYGADSRRAKLLLATALNDVFRALDWDLAQPVDKPVKWGTIQRDILWKYQKRERCDSVYLFSVEQATLESYAAAIEERLPRPLSELLGDTFRRVDAMGAEMAAQERAEGSAPKQVFHCPVEGCGYSTPERRYIMGHMRVHSGHKPFKCQEEGCGYASYSSQHLTRHARVHSGERPFKCSWPNCGYAASQKGHLQSHMLKHTGQRPFRCPFPGCDFACTRSWHLERHKSKHEEGGVAVDDNDEYADVSEDEAELEATQCRPTGSGVSVPLSGPVGLPGVVDSLQMPVHQQQGTSQLMPSDWAQPMSAPPMAHGMVLSSAPPVHLAPPTASGSAGVGGSTTPPLPAS
jgi:hypothetical protein